MTAPTRAGRSWPSAGHTRGPPKSAQKHKVLADAFKLAWIAVHVVTLPGDLRQRLLEAQHRQYR